MQRLRQEESDILWWLFGEYSRDLEQHISELSLSASCIIVGKELADLILVFPGPIPAKTDIFLQMNTSSNGTDARSRMSFILVHQDANQLTR